MKCRFCGSVNTYFSKSGPGIKTYHCNTCGKDTSLLTEGFEYEAAMIDPSKFQTAEIVAKIRSKEIA